MKNSLLTTLIWIAVAVLGASALGGIALDRSQGAVADVSS